MVVKGKITLLREMELHNLLDNLLDENRGLTNFEKIIIIFYKVLTGSDYGVIITTRAPVCQLIWAKGGGAI